MKKRCTTSSADGTGERRYHAPAPCVLPQMAKPAAPPAHSSSWKATSQRMYRVTSFSTAAVLPWRTCCDTRTLVSWPVNTTRP